MENLSLTKNRQNTNIEFGRLDTKAIKGIAVLLMLFHHLAGFPDRVPVGFAGFESLWGAFVDGGYLQSFAVTSKICVSLFFFLGGYGQYLRWKNSEYSVVTTILDLYKAYWKVLIIFIPIGLLFFGHCGDDINSLCTRFVVYGKAKLITTVLSDLIGWTSKFNSEWWFFKSYICVIPLGFLFCNGTKKINNVWMELSFVAIIDILIRSIFPSIAGIGAFSSLNSNLFYSSFFKINSYSSAFFAGIVFAKYDGVCRLKKKLLDLPCCTLVSLLGVGAVLWSRAYIIGERADIIYCALMIPMLSVFLDKVGTVKKWFAFLGKHSTNMWLIHSFYCYYFLEATYVVYCTSNVWVDLLVLILLSLFSSIILEAFYRVLGKIISRKK